MTNTKNTEGYVPFMDYRTYFFKADCLERTMGEVELQLNEKLLSLYQTHKPFIYHQNEDANNLPMAAEELKRI